MELEGFHFSSCCCDKMPEQKQLQGIRVSSGSEFKAVVHHGGKSRQQSLKSFVMAHPLSESREKRVNAAARLPFSIIV